MIPINISLTEETAAFVHRNIENGLYSDENELIRDAIRRLEIDRLMVENSKLANLKLALEKAVAEADAGDLVDYDLKKILSDES